MRQSPSSLSSRSGSLTPNQSRGPTFSPGPYSASPDPVCLVNFNTLNFANLRSRNGGVLITHPLKTMMICTILAYVSLIYYYFEFFTN